MHPPAEDQGMHGRIAVSAKWTCRTNGSGEKLGMAPRKEAKHSSLKDMGLPTGDRTETL
jgi:hypothetical protein